tara:strand:+ start:75 stop:587 length:513 start_codon:yes stop_codon:yes gene_type:complete
MEEQYRDYFGKPITKKKYEEQMEYRKKSQKERKEKDRKRLQKRFHDDGASPSQKLKDVIKRNENKEAYDKSGKVFRYKKSEYKGKIKELNPAVDVDEDMDMKDLMELYKKETDKRKKKQKLETQKYGRPKKKGELEVSKGSFIKKKRTGTIDYRKGGLFLTSKNNKTSNV